MGPGRRSLVRRPFLGAGKHALVPSGDIGYTCILSLYIYCSPQFYVHICPLLEMRNGAMASRLSISVGGIGEDDEFLNTVEYGLRCAATAQYCWHIYNVKDVFPCSYFVPEIS